MEANTFITGLVYLIIFLMFIGIVVWVSAEVQNVRFNNNLIHLKNLVSNLEVTKENYDDIRAEFDELYVYNDTQRTKVKKLWAKFMFKFRSVSPIVVEEYEFSPESVFSEYNHI